MHEIKIITKFYFSLELNILRCNALRLDWVIKWSQNNKMVHKFIFITLGQVHCTTNTGKHTLKYMNNVGEMTILVTLPRKVQIRNLYCTLLNYKFSAPRGMQCEWILVVWRKAQSSINKNHNWSPCIAEQITFKLYLPECTVIIYWTCNCTVVQMTFTWHFVLWPNVNMFNKHKICCFDPFTNLYYMYTDTLAWKCTQYY